MNHTKFRSLAITIALAILVVTGCGTSQATPASSIDPQVCPTSQPLSCPTSQPLSCPTSQPQACPTTAACPTAVAVQIPAGESDSGSTPTNPTLTFNNAGDQCTYTGPNTIPYGKFTLDIVPGQYPEGYGIGYVVMTLKEGMTFDEFNALPSSDQPYSVNILVDSGPVPQNKSFTFDLSTMSNYTKGDTLYLVCFYGNASDQSKIGEFVPIEVK